MIGPMTMPSVFDWRTKRRRAPCPTLQARSVGIETDVWFMTNVINAATQNKRWFMAVQLLQLMRSYGIAPNHVTYSSILSRMSKAKQVGAHPVRRERRSSPRVSAQHSGLVLVAVLSLSNTRDPVHRIAELRKGARVAGWLR